MYDLRVYLHLVYSHLNGYFEIKKVYRSRIFDLCDAIHTVRQKTLTVCVDMLYPCCAVQDRRSEEQASPKYGLKR